LTRYICICNKMLNETGITRNETKQRSY
jgi:hypothetical protein